MKYPSLKFFNKMNVTALHTDELAYYAYALISCQQPASVVNGEWYQMVDDVCSYKIAEFRKEINRRLQSEDKSDALERALGVLDRTSDLALDNRK